MGSLGVYPVPPSPADIASQVQGDIDKVNQVMSDAQSAMSSNIIGFGGNQAAADALSALQPNIQTWATSGQNAAAKGINPPGLNGWVGWRNAGQAFISGINQISSIGATATLDNIIATVKDVPHLAANTAYTVQQLDGEVKSVAKVAGNAVGTAIGHAAGSAVTSAVNSTETKVLVAIVGAGAAWFILHALKVLR